jgi:hypothetical protein
MECLIGGGCTRSHSELENTNSDNFEHPERRCGRHKARSDLDAAKQPYEDGSGVRMAFTKNGVVIQTA